jgi:hypothetical protein
MCGKRILAISIVVMLLGYYPVLAGVWWESGHLEINEGDIYDGEFFMIDHGSVDVFGGVIGKLETMDYSTGNIYGGKIDMLWTGDDTIVNIYGGALDWLACFPNSEVRLYAHDTIYHPEGGLYDNPWLEGKYLRDNSTFYFTLYGDQVYAQLSIVPEPTTLLLLGLGGIMIRNRKQ